MICLRRSTTWDPWNLVIVSYIHYSIISFYFIVFAISYTDTAYAENSGMWYLFDDKYVKEVPIKVSVTNNQSVHINLALVRNS